LIASIDPVPRYPYLIDQVSENANLMSKANVSAILIELYQGDKPDTFSTFFLRLEKELFIGVDTDGRVVF
jgi:hypothetical protein